MKRITNDFGQIKLGGVLIPGTFESCEIVTDGEVDESEIKGSKKKQMEILGFGLSTLKLTLKLNTEDKSTCYDKLDRLQVIFRKDPNKPTVYQITNKHAAARDIGKVIFLKLRSYETNDDDILLATLDFVEYNPAQVAIKKTAATSTKKKTVKKRTAKKTDKSPIKDMTYDYYHRGERKE